MQNGAIWGHFKVSYNIESSTILMTLIDKNFLKLSKFLADMNTSIALYKSTSKSRLIYASIQGKMPVILHGRPNISFQTSQYTKWPFSSSAFLLAYTYTYNCICRRIENWIYRIKYGTKCCWQIIPFCNVWFAIWQLLSWNPLMTNQCRPGMPRVLQRHDH